MSSFLKYFVKILVMSFYPNGNDMSCVVNHDFLMIILRYVSKRKIEAIEHSMSKICDPNMKVVAL